MPKILYDYVLFYANDPYQRPIDYKSIKELSIMFNISKKALYDRFRSSSIIYLENYGIERFKKIKGGY